MYRRALTTLTLVSWSALAAVPAIAGDVYFRRGDANASGKVDVSDPVFVLNHLFNGGEAIPCMDAADANDSGAIDVSDPIYTLLFLFAGGLEPPAPGVECGYDPSPDGIYCRSAGPCLQPSRFFEVIDGYAVVEGDIIIGRPEDFPGVPVIPLRGGGGGFGESDRERRWPRGFVPFVIHPFVPDQHRITDAMRHWENVTSIRFGQRTTETDFVLFTRGTECMSKVGRRGEQQQIIMSDLCSTGNLIHEIGHCVGLHHEHTRNDRDTFVEILWNNITEGMEDQFELGSPDDWDIGPYDYGSIMHYRTTAFGKSGMGGVLETIRILGTVPPGVTVGQRTALSAGDMAAVSFLYDQWQDWTRIDTGFSIPTRSPVTSLSRFPEHLDIFVIGTDGRVWSNFWNETSNNGFWNSWFPIGPDSSFPAQEIAAVSRHDNNIDLFVVGHDGVVYSAFWNPAGWSSWFPIDSTFRASPQKIGAVSRHAGQLDLFAVGNDGRVWSNFWNESFNNGLWNSWFPIGTNEFPLQAIAALTREPDKLDLFAVGNDGRVWSNFWNEGFNESRWNSWFQLDSKFTCEPQGIAAISRLPGQIDLFVVGSDDHIWSIFWSGVWSTWFPIDASLEVPVQNVSVVNRGSGTIDLFVMDKDRRVWSNFWHDGNAWTQWFPLEDEAFDGPAPAGISSVSRDPGHIDLFVTLSDGGVYTNWWGGAE